MSVLQEEGDTEEECIFLEAGEQTVMDESDVTDQDIINRLHGMQLDHESMKLLKHQLYGHPDFFCHTKPKLSQETVARLQNEPCKPLECFQACYCYFVVYIVT